MKLFAPTQPAILLRLEGAVMLAMSVLLYWRTGGNWWLFALLLFAPDLSMLGYLAGNRVGTAVYNSFHNYTLPASLAAFGLVGGNSLALSLSLIWFTHIGMDRMLGYGLKYQSGFKETHFGRV